MMFGFVINPFVFGAGGGGGGGGGGSGTANVIVVPDGETAAVVDARGDGVQFMVPGAGPVDDE